MKPPAASREASGPLAVALAASKPIDDAPRQPLAVELLLSESQRRAADPVDDLISELRAVAAEANSNRFNP